jgi:hypothetical protein
MNDRTMQDRVNLLTLEFLQWISSRSRTYADTMEAWRTSCPRNSVWEDALIAGLIQIENGNRISESKVNLTPKGKAILDGNSESQIASKHCKTSVGARFGV